MRGDYATEPDNALVSLALAGQGSGAYAELVRRHQAKVRGWLRSLTADHDLADDLAQETFVRAWQRLGQFKGHGRFLSWLMKLAYNEFLQARRGEGRYRKHVDTFAVEREVLAGGSDAHAGEGSDLDRYLAVLSPDERRVMILIYAYGLTHTETSRVTELPLGTVKSHVRRGRERVRSMFGSKEVVNA